MLGSKEHVKEAGSWFALVVVGFGEIIQSWITEVSGTRQLPRLWRERKVEVEVNP